MGGERACTLACPGVINQCLAEMATDLRMITRISTAKGMAEPKVTIEQGAVAFRGTAGQTALAEWVFNELDQPENWQALVPQSPNPVSHEYRLAVNGDDVVRVFYLANSGTERDLQELAMVVRLTGDIRWLFAYNAPKAVVARGTAGQIALAICGSNPCSPMSTSPQVMDADSRWSGASGTRLSAMAGTSSVMERRFS
jgi:hypothetical protein